MTQQSNTIAPSQWLESVSEECRRLIVAIGTEGYTSFSGLRSLFDMDVQVTDVTWEVKNLIASLAMTDADILKGRIILQHAAIQRLSYTRSIIANAFEIAAAGQAVSPKAG